MLDLKTFTNKDLFCSTILYFSDIHSDLVKACTEGDLNLFMSLSYNNQNVFQKLIIGDLNYPNKNKYGSYKPGDYLYVACENNHPHLVKQLIKLKAENKPYGKLTPLLLTCKKGYLDVRIQTFLYKLYLE